MPGFDGTGPLGDGRPGRGMGPCGRGARPFGNRMGRGGGFGGGRRSRCYWDSPRAYSSAGDRGIYPYDRAALEQQKEELQGQLKWLEEQLSKTEEE